MAPLFNQQTTGLEVVKAFPERTTNKTFIITGTTPNSIGSATALALAHGSPKALFLTGRSLSKIQPVITEINEINPDIKMIYVEMDLSDLDSVRKAAAFVLSCKEADEVHGLINNAGICCTMPFAVNKAGVEMQFATNHIGHFLFTNLILPRLLAGAASPNSHPRITVVASTGYTLSNVLFSDLNFQNGKTYNPWIAYGSSKTANILFSTYLSEHLKGKGIESFAVQPGMPRTALYKDIKETGITSIEEAGRILTEKYGASGANPSGDMSGDVKTIEEACSTPLAAALDPEFDGRSGLFLRNCQPFEVEPWAKDIESAERLWKMTEEMVGEKFVI